MTEKITDIHCLQCGAPAKFDIIRQEYVCGYCGGTVGIAEAKNEKRGYRKIQREKMQKSAESLQLFHAECSGCGADLVFAESEALQECPFCARQLVRSSWLLSEDMPECVIPFAITEEEAGQRVLAWCDANKDKKEAKRLRQAVSRINGFYLPYELVQGPVSMRVSRMDGKRTYSCGGVVKDTFVNTSKQLDNLLLDGMEPFDTDALTGFEFGYIAGTRVKIKDLDQKDTDQRIKEECEETYTPSVRTVLETKAVEVHAGTQDTIAMPVLLPVYYIHDGDLAAAVNGQTGKVSVRALKESSWYFVPWWIKAIGASIVITLLVFGALRLFGMDASGALLLTGILGFFFLIVFLCLYSDTVHNAFRIDKGRKIFTSGEETFVREYGKLVKSDAILERKTEPPVFFETLEGKTVPVELRFTTVWRVIRMALLCFIALFLPVILALLLNGFDFAKLNLGGSAVWFCIAVPVVPVYLLKFGIVELHDRPWIYIIDENGAKHRYSKSIPPLFTKENMGMLLRALFVPPGCLAVWFGILCFFVIVYLTAFGFD